MRFVIFFRILNSHGNTTCFVFMVTCQFMMYGLIYNEILFDCKYDNYLETFGFVLVSRSNGTIKSLFVCTKANYGSCLRAAARYHANEGVSVK